MSPEQLRSLSYLTPASDLYSLGLLLYEMLAGKMYSKVKRLPLSQENDQIPDWLDALVVKLLEKESELRYREAEEVVRVLETGLEKLKAEEVEEKTTPLPLAAQKILAKPDPYPAPVHLVVSIHTVNSHLRSIYDKLEVTSRTEAARYAILHKLV